MNEQLQTAVVEILNRAISGIDASVDFMQAELPDVIEQLLLWYAVKSVIYASIGVLILYACYRAIKLAARKPEKGMSNSIFRWCKYDETHKSTAESVLLIFLIFPIGLALIPLFEIMTALQIWIAPKIWLMEYAADLVK